MKPISRGLIETFFAITLSFGYSITKVHADEFTDGATKFIVSLAAKAETSLLGKKISVTQHQKTFRRLMLESFDLEGIGKWVVGRYWRRIPKSERAEYLKLFENFIVATYSKRFRVYTKAKLKINGITRQKNSAFVSTQIDRKNSKPIRVTWRIKLSNGNYKIIDIVVEGVSWIQTQRSEFVSVIRNSGGKVSGLITALNKKIIDLKSIKN